MAHELQECPSRVEVVSYCGSHGRARWFADWYREVRSGVAEAELGAWALRRWFGRQDVVMSRFSCIGGLVGWCLIS